MILIAAIIFILCVEAPNPIMLARSAHRCSRAAYGSWFYRTYCSANTESQKLLSLSEVSSMNYHLMNEQEPSKNSWKQFQAILSGDLKKAVMDSNINYPVPKFPARIVTENEVEEGNPTTALWSSLGFVEGDFTDIQKAQRSSYEHLRVNTEVLQVNKYKWYGEVVGLLPNGRMKNSLLLTKNFNLDIMKKYNFKIIWNYGDLPNTEWLKPLDDSIVLPERLKELTGADHSETFLNIQKLRDDVELVPLGVHGTSLERLRLVKQEGVTSLLQEHGAGLGLHLTPELNLAAAAGHVDALCYVFVQKRMLSMWSFGTDDVALHRDVKVFVSQDRPYVAVSHRRASELISVCEDTWGMQKELLYNKRFKPQIEGSS